MSKGWRDGLAKGRLTPQFVVQVAELRSERNGAIRSRCNAWINERAARRQGEDEEDRCNYQAYSGTPQSLVPSNEVSIK